MDNPADVQENKKAAGPQALHAACTGWALLATQAEQTNKRVE